jgi:hypothetical protein
MRCEAKIHMKDHVPYTKPEILSALDSLRSEGLEYWNDIDPVRFGEPVGDAWSPAEHLLHLVMSTQPVNRALTMPRPALEERFGIATRSSLGYTDLVARYREALGATTMTNPYAPPREEPPADARSWQMELTSKSDQALDGLANAVASWDDDDLDRFQLPHPLLGPLTIREMLLFTLYHYEHHRSGVAKRRSAQTSQPS